MTQEEFDKLATDMNQLIAELSGNNHLNFDALIPADELVVELSNHIIKGSSIRLHFSMDSIAYNHPPCWGKGGR